MRSKDNLARILKRQVQKKESRLTSGKHSHYYVDCRPLVLDPYARVIITSQIAQTLTKFFPVIPCRDFDAIGGPIFSGAVMAVAFANLLSPYSLVIPFAFHTYKDTLIVPEGRIQNVFLIDDVLSTGGTLNHMADKCIEQGWEVKGAIVLLDREEPESLTFKQRFPVVSVFTSKEVDDAL